MVCKGWRQVARRLERNHRMKKVTNCWWKNTRHHRQHQTRTENEKMELSCVWQELAVYASAPSICIFELSHFVANGFRFTKELLQTTSQC